MKPAILRVLRQAGLCGAAESPRAQALGGGVSSDIWRVDLARGPVCVKQALPRLRVAQNWEAPVERNRFERLWIETAFRIVAGCTPRVLAHDDDAGLFVMEYLDPARHPVWKELLRQGRAEAAFAAQVGATLAAIHAATAGRETVARTFATDPIFYAIRLEPYLVFTSSKYPELSARLLELVNRTASTKTCLVHGDVSPKNILAGPAGPVFLDAECAWYGDPAFDLAFCLNHLLLKCLWVPQARNAFLECFDALSRSYLQAVSFGGIEARAASLLPALLLARVDGKSPVEYLAGEAQKRTVRETARAMIISPVEKLSEIRQAWQRSST